MHFLRKHAPLFSIPIDRPIFIVGLQGGGLTIISRILRRVSDVVSVGGNADAWFDHDEMQNEKDLNLPEEFRLFYCRHFGDENFLRGGWVYGTDQYIDHFVKMESDVDAKVAERFRTILKTVIRSKAKDPFEARFLDKSQTYGLKIPYIDKILEKSNPKFIIIARNPYIACRKAVLKPALSNLNVSEEERLKLAATHYKNCMERMITENDARSNVTFLRFEDFLLDPEASIEALCQFAELPYSPALMPSPDDNITEKWYPIRGDANQDQLEQISKNEVALVNNILGDLPTRLGYAALS